MAKAPEFKFCGKFAGKTSAARWLKALNHELESLKDESTSKVPLEKYLTYLDMLMTEDAADWVEENQDASRLLAKEDPDQDTVDQFISLFKERFPSKISEAAPVTFDSELSELKQKEDEALTSYYSRTINLMQKYGAKDRVPAKVLSLAESSLLDTFLRQWIRGLQDGSVKRKAVEGMGAADRSMRKLFELADAARRVNAEIKKSMEEDARDLDLEFYRSLVEKNTSRPQIEAMLASHRQQAREGQWSFYMDHTATEPVRGMYPMPKELRPPPLVEAPDKSNQQPPYPSNQRRSQGPGNYQGNYRSSNFRRDNRSLPDKKISRNQFTNGSRSYTPDMGDCALSAET